jgi:hypothetical protein
MVVMPLTINHIQLMAESIPGIMRYAELGNQGEEILVITHMFVDSQIARSRTITPGATIKEINGKSVKNLTEFRDALRHNKSEFLTIKAVDNVSRASENIFVALPLEKIVKEEPRLAATYHYTMSPTVKEILQMHLPLDVQPVQQKLPIV